ncbi:MAG: hypothetical protein CMJ65_03625 [Planctomycetaceae bacterium]|nr:hypothetical protein [Planctomycetaceae bacterium]
MPCTTRHLPVLLLGLLITAWLLPVTLGQHRPADPENSTVTLPLMSFYGQSLQRGQLPLWNDRLDFGTPALADGRIGVLYPPHLVLYRLFAPVTAFRMNLVLHYFLAAWFAYLCGRGFGLGRSAAGLAGVVFVGQGFFTIHLAQQWSFTAGCWLPLAVLAGWRWMISRERSWLLALPLILSIQALAGHFQVAFFTLVSVLVVTAVAVCVVPEGRRVGLRRSGGLVLALAGTVCLVAVQWLPTLELLRQADWRGRGIEYLGSFAVPPALAVQYVAPTLTSLHPWWQQLLAAPWHSDAGECLNYVGLIPFSLALATLVYCRREPAVICCGVLWLVSFLLSLGPHLSTVIFEQLIRLPGFGMFTSPARWSIVSGLALGLLAGRGLDAVDGVRLRRSWRWFVAGSVLAILVATWSIRLAAQKSGRFHRTADASIRQELISHGIPSNRVRLDTPADAFADMIGGELVFPLANLGCLLVVLCIPSLTNQSTRRIVLLLGWSVLDLSVSGSLLRRAWWEPVDPATRKSVVLGRLAEEDRARIIGAQSATPLQLGHAAITLQRLPDMHRYWADAGHPPYPWARSATNLPVLWRWNDIPSRISYSQLFEEDHYEFIRLAGIRFYVEGPVSASPPETLPFHSLLRQPDPWLSRHAFGSGFASNPSSLEWTIWELPTAEVHRAWFFPLEDPPLPATDPRDFRQVPPARRGMLDSAQAADLVADSGSSVELTGRAERPGVLVLADSHYPGWEAVLTQSGKSRPVPIQSAFGGWRAVEIPSAGEYRIAFHFRPRSFRRGLRISLLSLVAWGMVCFLFLANRQRRSTDAGSAGKGSRAG